MDLLHSPGPEKRADASTGGAALVLRIIGQWADSGDGMSSGRACNMRVGSLVAAVMTDAATEGLEQALEAERRVQPGGNLRAAWEALLKDARDCTRCDLYRHATQTVFGEGPLDASIMFVGEQPGDQEDLAGRPFVGPAGALFDAALEKAGIDRSTVYVTNAVKHFKFVARGKRRIHNKPDAGEIEACRWWIDHERELIQPPVTVALGATAARSLTGKTVTISRARDAPMMLGEGHELWITVHPSFLLRMPDPERKREERARFVRDLKRIKARAAALSA
jgi:DNA polymerase